MEDFSLCDLPIEIIFMIWKQRADIYYGLRLSCRKFGFYVGIGLPTEKDFQKITSKGNTYLPVRSIKMKGGVVDVFHSFDDKRFGQLTGPLRMAYIWYNRGMIDRPGDNPAIIVKDGDQHFYKNGKRYKTIKAEPTK